MVLLQLFSLLAGGSLEVDSKKQNSCMSVFPVKEDDPREIAHKVLLRWSGSTNWYFRFFIVLKE